MKDEKLLSISKLRDWLFAWRKEEITMSRLRELIIEELQKNKKDSVVLECDSKVITFRRGEDMKTFTTIAMECAMELRKQKYGDYNLNSIKPVDETYSDGDVIALAKNIANEIKDEVLKGLLHTTW